MSLETNGGDDEDCLFLERVLDKLYDFGSAPKKKLKSQKKKKRKRCDEEEEEALHAVNDVSCDSEDSRTENLSAHHQQQPSQMYHTGPTIQQENRVEVVTFQDPRKKLKTKQNPAPRNTPPQITEKQQSDQQELTLEKARLEVHRFGITGYKKEQQRVFEQDRAVMLGARPLKKEYVNYKMLQQQIKEKKQNAKDEAQLEKKKKKKKQSNQSRDKKKPSSGSGGGPSGQLGRFKNGMLILSSKEIQKIKKHK
ncbi:uncharacterized protein C1orf131 homolog isoform X3 [Melanotaenia boesemani]|uniref:uncharacterized protein C1orf131 homolog isoform X3 n=1 Tax=Melanotaenia boesemani TaxID=1250792 RepID=UPI001C051FEA|nr:uncharacterized protein C1orf131 homolog isoform X3 [Melanotaenia boesemani]